MPDANGNREPALLGGCGGGGCLMDGAAIVRSTASSTHPRSRQQGRQ